MGRTLLYLRIGESRRKAVSSREKPWSVYSSVRCVFALRWNSRRRRLSSRLMKILLLGPASSGARPVWSECRWVRQMSVLSMLTPSSASPPSSASRHSSRRKPVSMSRLRLSSLMR